MEMEPAEIVEQEKKPGKLWIGLIVVYLLFCFASVGVGIWLSYTFFQAAAEKDRIPYATATAAAQWPVILSDDFSKVSDVWYVGSYSENGYTDTRSISNGVYNWELKSADRYTFWQPTEVNIGDFVLSVDVKHTNGSPYDSYGLIFRNIAENYYMFSISDQGSYAVTLHSTDRWNDIIPYTPSGVIKRGEFNRLTVLAQRSHFQLFINDQYITEFEDFTLPSGDVGLQISPNTGSPLPSTQLPQGIAHTWAESIASVAFDNFEVRSPQGTSSSGSKPPELPEIKPVSGRLVFASDRDGNRNIYTINSDGSGLKQLTDDPAADYAPRWSPDGKKIVFVSRRSGNSEIYTMDADGSNLIQLTDNPAEDISPDWSPDGRQIIFASRRNLNFDIYLMASNGEKGSLTQLTNNKYDEINPSISPDGSEILYQAKKNIIYRLMVMQKDGSGAKDIQTYNSWRTASDASWSPDGLKIVYAEKDDQVPGEIYIKKARESLFTYSETLLTSNMINCLYPNWSPGSEQVLFVSSMNGQPDIYIMPVDGNGIFRVTHSEAAEESPDWTNP